MAIKLSELKDELDDSRQSLVDLEKYIEDLSSFLPLAICFVNSLGFIVDINQAFKDLTGFKRLEIIGKDLEELFLEKGETQTIIKEIKKKKIIKNKELTLVAKIKKQVAVNVYFSARKDKLDELIGFFVGIVDISELKKLQEELEEKVKERTKDLQEKIEELEKFNKLAVGRELKMLELKEEIEKLKKLNHSSENNGFGIKAGTEPEN